MTRKIGDAVFSLNGKPGLVIDRDQATGRLTVERNGEGLEKAKRRGYVNGLSSQERVKYDEIRDQVLEQKDPNKKVETLQSHIKELKTNPKNFNITKYVEADLAHTMITYGLHPKIYNADEHHVR